MFKVKGIDVEAIQTFADHVLVQEIESKKIYLIAINDVDAADASPVSEKSNVISLKGWLSCRAEEEKEKKVSLQKTRIKSKGRSQAPRPRLRLVAP